MKNLAGVSMDDANSQVAAELAEAKVGTLLLIKPGNRQVKATVVGMVVTEDCFISFQRDWYY